MRTRKNKRKEQKRVDEVIEHVIVQTIRRQSDRHSFIFYVRARHRTKISATSNISLEIL